jgi:putative transcriptional regulator
MPKAILCVLLAGAAWAQDLATGKILVASRKTRDADFAHAVVLLVQYDRQSAIGLLLNRPANVALSEVFPEIKGGGIKVYAGGPVTTGIRALYRSRSRPSDAASILTDVFMISNKTLLGELAAAGVPASRFRVYAGYVGWTGGQLKGEVARGLWYVLAGDADTIFDRHPETLWSRLLDRIAHSRSASNWKPGPQ